MKKALIIGGIILIIITVIFEIWVSTTYANKPINEVPFWVLWLLR